MICTHPSTDPVALTTGDVVAHICLDCNATIPDPAWPDLPPGLVDYATPPDPVPFVATHRAVSSAYPAVLARAARRMWTDLDRADRSYLIYRTALAVIWVTIGLYLIWTGPHTAAHTLNHQLGVFIHELTTGARAFTEGATSS